MKNISLSLVGKLRDAKNCFVNSQIIWHHKLGGWGGVESEIFKK